MEGKPPKNTKTKLSGFCENPDKAHEMIVQNFHLKKTLHITTEDTYLKVQWVFIVTSKSIGIHIKKIKIYEN